VLRRLGAVAVVLGHVALAAAYSRATPAGEGPDEPGHIAYVEYLGSEKRLPLREGVAPALAQQAKHPPLYYAAAAVWIAPFDFEGLLFFPNPQLSMSRDGPRPATVHRHTADEQPPMAHRYQAVRALRLLSVMLGAITVAATFSLSRAVFRGSTGLPVAAAAATAFLPQFLFMHGVANNDVLANTLAAVAMVVAVRVVQRGARATDLTLLGVTLGLGLMTKLTLIPQVIVGCVAVALAGRLQRVPKEGAESLGVRQSRRLVVRAAVFAGLPMLALAGWWFLRNLFLGDDLLGWQGFEESAAALSRRVPLSVDLPGYFNLQFKSFVGMFGWLTAPLPQAMYWIAAGVAVAAACGLIVFAARPTVRRGVGPEKRGLALCWVSVILVYAMVFRLAFDFDLVVAQGRYLFTALPAFSVLVVLGLSRLVPPTVRDRAMMGFAAAWLVIGWAGLEFGLRPAFALPQPVPPDVAARAIAGLSNLGANASPSERTFGEEWIRLVGLDLPRTRIAPGESLTATAVWETLGHQPEEGLVEFAQIVESGGRVLAQIDRLPLGGRYPSASWVAGRSFAAELDLHVPSDAGPTIAELSLGWYRDEPPNQRIRLVEGGADAIRIPIVIGPPERGALSEAHSRGDYWGEPATVVLREFAATDGNLTLVWEALAQPAADYTVFVHVVDRSGNLATTVDGPPVNGRYPTSVWEPEEVIHDVRALPVFDLGPATYDLLVGLYREGSGERVIARSASGERYSGESVLLGQLRVGAQGDIHFVP
jgi:hypothetical protein